jgi:hypothetical protein
MLEIRTVAGPSSVVTGRERGRTAVEELVYFVGRREARPEETVQPVTATPS